MAKSRQKMLDKMSALPESMSIDPSVRFKFPNPGNFEVVCVFIHKPTGHVSGGFGIRLVGVGFHYPGQDLLFSGVEFSINQV